MAVCYTDVLVSSSTTEYIIIRHPSFDVAAPYFLRTHDCEEVNYLVFHRYILPV